MNRITLCVLMCLLWTFPLRAQWTLIHPYPQNVLVEDMQFDNGQDGWFVTSAGTIWRTTDGGTSWKNQRKASKWGLKSVSFVGANDGWAAGTYEPLLRTTNGGTDWYSLGFAVPEATRLTFLSPVHGWATTASAGAFRTDDGGVSWSQSFQWPFEFNDDVWVPPGPIVGLCTVDSIATWVIGRREFREGVPGFGNIIARTENGGQTWDTVRINFPGRVTDILFVTSMRGWYLADSSSIVGTGDGGASWQIEFPPSPSFTEPLRAISGFGTSHAWAVGDRGLIVYTTNAGTSWKTGVVDSTINLSSVAFVDHSTGWCGGTKGELFRTNNGGATWTRLSRGYPHDFRAVEFLTPLKGWAASGSTGNAALHYSSDGGYSWTLQLSITSGYFIDVEMVDTLLGWAVGSMTGPKLFKTTDGGSTWQPQLIALGSSVHRVVFIDPQHGWICGDYIGSPGPEYQVVHRTTDGGHTWITVQLDSMPFSPTVMDLCALESQTVWCVNQYGVFKSLNGGQSWQHVFYDSTVSYKTSMTFVDSLRGWIVGSGGLVLRSTDGGLSWSRQTSGTMTQLQRVRFASPSRGWAVGLGATLHTSDGGLTWVRDSVETYPYMFDISILPQGNTLHAWAVGFSGTVLKHLSPLTSVGEPRLDTPSSIALLQNYPNPFNPSTSISYRLSATSFVSLSVFDILGRELATLVNEVKAPGEHEVVWNANGVPSGVYFYRLQTSGRIEVRKMVLTR